MEPYLDSVSDWQEHPRTSLDLDVTGADRAGLTVIRVDGEEATSRPFRFEVCFSAAPVLDAASLLGAAATLTFRQGSRVRAVRGRIGGLAQGERAPSGACLYRATIVPGPAPLSDSLDALPEVPGGETLLEAGGAAPAPTFRVLRVSARRSPGAVALSGESALCTLSAGHRFTLRGHFRDDLNQEYVVLKVSHRAEVGTTDGYRCAVEAVNVSSLPATEVSSSPASGASRRARSTAGGAAGRGPSRGGRSLPLEAHLSLPDFGEQDYSAGSTSGPWARIYVPSGTPATPVGYLRLGATPISTDVEVTSFQAFWPATWPKPANYNGDFLYTDTNRILSSNSTSSNTFEYAGVSRYLKVGPATTVTPNHRLETAYTPTYTSITPASNPGTDSTWDAPSTGLDLSSTSLPTSYTDTVTINGASRLTVNDLLLEQVQGDYVSYVHGNRYEFVAGHYAQTTGNSAAYVVGDLTKTINGNTTNSYSNAGVSNASGTVTVTNNYSNTLTNNYNSSYNANYGDVVNNTYESTADITYFGILRTTSHVWEKRFSYGITVGVRMGVAFDIVLGAWGIVSLGPYLRFISTRFSFFETKFDFVSVIKIDCGNIKVDGYSVILKKQGFKAKKAVVKGKQLGLAIAFSPFSLLSSAIEVNCVSCQVHAPA